MTLIQSLASAFRKPLRRHNLSRLALEMLEDRAVPAGVYPNDPGFSTQWMLHNTGQTGGAYDADIDAPAAWSVTTGSMATVVAVIDNGVDYTDPDLYLNVWLNPGEIPASLADNLVDADGDGLMTFRDLNAPANTGYVTDLNGNGYVDGGDLLQDTRWENGLDEDGNGKIDDLVGWDSHDNDNDPKPEISGGSHGTNAAKFIGALTDNNLGGAGLNWAVRLMAVRIRNTGTDMLDVNAAAGLDYAVASGAPISINSWRARDYNYSQVAYDAISRAGQAGHLFVAAAWNDFLDNDVTPFYPASYDLDNIISVTGTTAFDQLAHTNYGAISVDLGASHDTSSGASQYTAGAAALLKSLHPEWGYTQLKAQLMATVDPLPSLSGKCVTGGRLNVAKALEVVYSTKFYVPNDATANQTYEYDSSDELLETYSLTTANTAPRGAASTAAGDTVWVVDANKIVYVYNTSGGLLGSWTAGSLAANAQVEGIATNGTDIWLVDNKQDKVFKYTGAATRLSGSQNAASSFSLNSGNKNPKGIVTDGVHLWVVNDSTTDKVFKYTLAGGLVGSWTISGGGGAPTGITLDPTSVAHLWIVDNGTDRVYQYDNAAGRTSGSQAASVSFALAAGNTNPQDIADPPVPGTLAEASPLNTERIVEASRGPAEVWRLPLRAEQAPALAELGNWNLGGTTLGLASSSTLWLGDNAADHGWFVDQTPWDDSEFNTSGDQGEQNRVDLLTVLAHEIGHLLGHDHDEDGVMADTLGLGVRHMPDTTA